jgi:hypothetical protein
MLFQSRSLATVLYLALSKYATVCYLFHKRPPLITYPEQNNPSHIFPCLLFKKYSTHINMCVFSNLQAFLAKYCMHFSFLPRLLLAPPISSSLIKIINIPLYVIFSTSPFSPHSLNLFSNTLSLRSFPNVRDEISLPSKTTVIA